MFDVTSSKEAEVRSHNEGTAHPARADGASHGTMTLDCAAVVRTLPVPAGARITYDRNRSQNLKPGTLIAVLGVRRPADPPALSGQSEVYRCVLAEIRPGGLWLFGPDDKGRLAKYPGRTWGVLGVVVEINVNLR